jgi:hypothetical protein
MSSFTDPPEEMKKQGKGTVYEKMKWQEWKRSGQGIGL